MSSHRPKIGLALGSGTARGWAHIGVIRALRDVGIVPDVICGSSIGAFVGAIYANGDLDKLEAWVSGLRWSDVVGLLDISWRSGLIKGNKLMQFFADEFTDSNLEDLPMPFGVVTTDLSTGREVWLRDGRVIDAVRASIALPGLFTPMPYERGYYVDGGLVNPVPVTLCRAMGAELVVAVDLGSDIVGKALRSTNRTESVSEAEVPSSGSSSTWRLFARRQKEGEGKPSMSAVLMASINIMQVRIARSRLAGEPADILIQPRLAQLGFMDYHRGVEAIAEGQAAVRRVLPTIEHMLNLDSKVD